MEGGGGEGSVKGRTCGGERQRAGGGREVKGRGRGGQMEWDGTYGIKEEWRGSGTG